MCMASKPPAPTPLPEPPAVAKEVDQNAQGARDDQKRKAALAAGRQSSILTGAKGLTAPASTASKSLLGL